LPRRQFIAAAKIPDFKFFFACNRVRCDPRCRIAATIAAELKFFNLLLFCPFGQSSCQMANLSLLLSASQNTMETLSIAR
jgi:hypothetical protein